MFVARFFPTYSVTIFHLPDEQISFDDLLEPRLVFVWDDLMEAARVFELLGRYVPFAAAVLPGYAREVFREGEDREYRLMEAEGALTTGCVLLGVTDVEIEAIDQHEQVPIHRVRHTVRVRVGDLERVATVHSGAGSYLGEPE